MRQTRLYIEGTYEGGSGLRLEPDKHHYVSRVLRLRAGDKLRVFDGNGREFSAAITKISHHGTEIRIVDETTAQTESRLRVHLVQGISRAERMDIVIQKATELGVKRITTVLTRHGVVKLDAARGEKRRKHWQKVAASACEQSGRVKLPLIDAPVPLLDWLADKPGQVDAELILRPDAHTPLTAIRAPQTKVCLLIGPEGGFAGDEYDAAEAAGFLPVSIGPRILRTETAAIAALAVLQSLWGDLG
jgi:16S rRNA (uracil1498-N3)-methyltransferase